MRHSTGTVTGIRRLLDFFKIFKNIFIPNIYGEYSNLQ